MGNVHMEATQINYRDGDKKMSVADALKNAGNTGLAHTADIAPEFSTDSAYSAGDFVYHNGSLYEFTANHAAGAWSTDDTQTATVGGKIASLEGDVGNLSSVKANQITIAPAFSSETAYDVGDIVYYNGLTYRCTNAHEGAWDADDFAATTVANELSSLKNGLINKAAANRGAFNGSGTAGGKTSINISDYGTNFPALILCTTWRSYSLYAIFKEPNNLYTFSLEAGGAAAPTLTASDATTILITNTDSAGGRYMLLV